MNKKKRIVVGVVGLAASVILLLVSGMFMGGNSKQEHTETADIEIEETLDEGSISIQKNPVVSDTSQREDISQKVATVQVKGEETTSTPAGNTVITNLEPATKEDTSNKKPEPKPTSKPTTKDAVTNPDKKPAYSKDIKTADNSDGNENKDEEPNVNTDGKIYVDGFGWVEDEGGGGEEDTFDSDGDINEQIGDME